MPDSLGMVDGVTALVSRATETTTTPLFNGSSPNLNIIPNPFFVFLFSGLTLIGFIFLLLRVKGFLEEKYDK